MSLLEIAEVYRRFATIEAAGRSPVYVEITGRISRDARTLSFLADLPPPKRQPNLLLAAVQYLCGRLTGWAAFTSALDEREADIVDVIRTRATQTKSPRPVRNAAARPRAAPPAARPRRGRRLGRAVPVSRPVRLRLRRPRPARDADPALHRELDDPPAA